MKRRQHVGKKRYRVRQRRKLRRGSALAAIRLIDVLRERLGGTDGSIR